MHEQRDTMIWHFVAHGGLREVNEAIREESGTESDELAKGIVHVTVDLPEAIADILVLK
jgi:hypothetical protein